MSGLVVFLDPLSPERLDAIRALLPQGFTLANARSRAPADQIEAIAPADFAISGDVPITGAMMRAAPGLKALHKWGVGIDNFDLDTARTLGLRVMRTTGSNALAVAETALGLMLALARYTVQGHLGIARGEWLKGHLAQTSFTLSGRTVGIVGLGAIGGTLARLLRGFECRVLYAMPRRLPPEEEAALGVEHRALDDLLPEVDVLSLHCPLNDATRGLIGKAALSRMRGSAILINTARGGILVEPDLVDALKAGTIRAAAVDVFEVEPIQADHPLKGLDNVILTPHSASLAADRFPITIERMFNNLQALSQGRPLPPRDVVI